MSKTARTTGAGIRRTDAAVGAARPSGGIANQRVGAVTARCYITQISEWRMAWCSDTTRSAITGIMRDHIRRRSRTLSGKHTARRRSRSPAPGLPVPQHLAPQIRPQKSRQRDLPGLLGLEQGGERLVALGNDLARILNIWTNGLAALRGQLGIAG